MEGKLARVPDLFAKQRVPKGMSFEYSAFRQIIMLEKIITLGSILAMGFGVLLWAQSSFVDAMDFKQYRYSEAEDEINYLEDKKLRLEQSGAQLSFEDKRQLDRLKLKLEKLRQELGN